MKSITLPVFRKICKYCELHKVDVCEIKSETHYMAITPYMLYGGEPTFIFVSKSCPNTHLLKTFQHLFCGRDILDQYQAYPLDWMNEVSVLLD